MGNKGTKVNTRGDSAWSREIHLSVEEASVLAAAAGAGSFTSSTPKPSSKSQVSVNPVRQTENTQETNEESPRIPGTYGTPSNGVDTRGSVSSTGTNMHVTEPVKPSQRYDSPITRRGVQLPEFFALDVALTAVTVVAFCFVLFNLQSVMLAIARVVYTLLSMTFQLTLIVVVVVVALYLFRRRRW